MGFFKYNFMSDGNSLDFTPTNITTNGIKLSNGIFYQMDFVDILLTSLGVFNETIPTQWTADTVASCDFNGNINAGSISTFIASVSKLEVQKREVGSSEWITLATIYKQGSTITASFTMYDSYSANDTMYEYALVPFDINGNEGSRFAQKVLSQFNQAYICDAQQIYELTAEWSIDNVQTNQKSAVYEPFGAKYPFVAYNATTQYRSGSSTAVLLAPTSQQRSTSYLDRKAQKQLVDNFNSWLTNRGGKILKDYNGNIRLIAVHDNISNSYYKELGNGLASTNFQWLEIGEFTQKDLSKNGMLNLPIIPKIQT